MEQLIELDPRRRTTVRAGRHSTYLATEEPDGTVVMVPAIVISEAEAELLHRPEILLAIEESRAKADAGSPGAGRPVRRK